MNQAILLSVLALSGLGTASAVILYLVAQKFKVYEDPRIDQVSELLPGANCGGCGYPGCRAFAENCVKAGTPEAFFCPVGGNSVMEMIAKLLGGEVSVKEPMIAVIRCSGSKEKAPRKAKLEGVTTCYFANSLFAGESGCQYGCLGLGECVAACKFDAIYMDEITGLPVVKDNCIACGACVTSCPRNIIELRNKGKGGKRIFVSCINKEKGALSVKNCSVSCIGCGKCVKVCPHEAITLENNLAYIDYIKCKLCRKCVAECPTLAIHEINFPARKLKAEEAEIQPEPVKASQDTINNPN